MLKESLDKLRYQRQLAYMQNELFGKLLQVQPKETKNVQIRTFLTHMPSKDDSVVVEEETQCSFDAEGHDEQGNMVRQLSDMLRQREEYGVGLHLATNEKEEQMGQLQLKINKMEETISNLASQLQLMEEQSITSIKNIEKMEQIISSLQLSNAMKDRLLQDKQIKIASLSEKLQNLIIHQQRRKELQLIIIQNQKQIQQLTLAKMQGERDIEGVGKLYEALEKEHHESNNQMEKLKNILNNYDWKLFCIETELDLSNKERKHFKYLIEKNQIKLNQYESLLKEQRINIYSLEQENKAFENQNKFQQMQLSHKQIQIDSFLNQLEELKEYYEHYDQLELKYRVHQKDQQLKELSSFLKEKLNENQQLKIQCTNFEQQVQRLKAILQKAEIETYELEQSIIEHEEIMQNQTIRIEQFTQQIDFLNQRMNESSLMYILRTKECEQNFSRIVKEKSQKISELSVEITQRQNKFNKEIEQMSCQIQELESSFNSIIQQNEDLQIQINHLRKAINEKNIEIQQITKKCIRSEKNIQKKQKAIQSQQIINNKLSYELSQIKKQQDEFKKVLFTLQEDLRTKQQQIRVLEESVTNHIEVELNYQFQLKQIKKVRTWLESQKQELLNTNKTQEQALAQMKKEVQYLNLITNERFQEIIDYLSQPAISEPEETVKFQILDQQDQYEAIPAEIDQKIELTKKIDSYRSEVINICSKYDE